MLILPDVHANDVIECAHGPCKEQVNKDDSYRYGVGISHYSTKGISYMQVHSTPHSCSDEHAQKVAHSRLDQYKSLEHGVMDASLNPNGNEYSNDFVRECIEYTPNVSHAPLPANCCVCNKPLDGEAYIPHVDSNHQGTCYQEILQKRDESPKSLETYTLGACSQEHAVQAAHEILSTIVGPYKG